MFFFTEFKDEWEAYAGWADLDDLQSSRTIAQR